jgi:hypothetical protein
VVRIRLVVEVVVMVDAWYVPVILSGRRTASRLTSLQ